MWKAVFMQQVELALLGLKAEGLITNFFQKLRKQKVVK